MDYESFVEKKDSSEDIVQLSREEFDLLSNGDLEDKALQDLLIAKGIVLDSGVIKVEVDGKFFEIETRSDDLGTRIKDYHIE